MMINCLIVDDEPVARGIIRNYCSHLTEVNIVAECGNALEAKEILTAKSIDLIFLDIHMPVLNGIGFLHTLSNAPQVIFTTAYQEHAVSAFDLAACDYLLKPFSLERFIIAVDKAKENIAKFKKTPDEKNPPTTPDLFFIKSDGKIYQVPFKNCLYGEAQGNYTKVVTTDKTILTKMTFAEFIAMFPPAQFIRVHRSFLINKAMISHIEGNRIFIQSKEIPIAGNYKAAFLKSLGIAKN